MEKMKSDALRAVEHGVKAILTLHGDNMECIYSECTNPKEIANGVML